MGVRANSPGAPSERQRDVVVREWRANWRTGLATMIGMGLGVSVAPTVSSLFVEPLQQTFGWSRGQIALGQTASLFAAVAAPFVGRWMDRYPARWFIAGGFAILGLSYLALALMGGGIELYYLFFAGVTVGGVATSGLGFSRVISATFVGSRGLSLAVARSGLAISSAFLPIALFALMSVAGWRGGYALMAALALLIALPASWFWIDIDPGRVGARVAHAGVPWRTLLSNRRVWTVALAGALAYTPLLAIMSQLKPLLVGEGIAPATAAQLLGVMGASTFVGAIVTGALVDRYWAPLIAFVMMAGAAIGAAMLMYIGGDTRLAILAILLLGLAQGAELDIVSFVVARYFGVRSFGSIYGVTVFAIATGIAGGTTLIGYLYDRFGNYDLALILAAIAFVLSGIAYLTLGRYPAIEDAAFDPIDAVND